MNRCDDGGGGAGEIELGAIEPLRFSDYISNLRRATTMARAIEKAIYPTDVQVIAPPNDCSGPKEDECVRIMTKSIESNSRHYLDIARV